MAMQAGMGFSRIILLFGTGFVGTRNPSSVYISIPCCRRPNCLGYQSSENPSTFKLTDSQVYIHWKGAVEIVLASCTRYLDTDGCLQSIVNEVVSNKQCLNSIFSMI